MSAPSSVPAGDMRRYPELVAEEARRQAAGEDVQIRQCPSTDDLRILPRQRGGAS